MIIKLRLSQGLEKEIAEIQCFLGFSRNTSFMHHQMGMENNHP
jgi:DNA-binding CsgD family transcriptional regulator